MWDLWLYNLMSPSYVTWASFTSSPITLLTFHNWFIGWLLPPEKWRLCLPHWLQYPEQLRAQQITEDQYFFVCCCFSFQSQERTEPWKLLIRALVLQNWCWLHASMPCLKDKWCQLLFAFDTSQSLSIFSSEERRLMFMLIANFGQASESCWIGILTNKSCLSS